MDGEPAVDGAAKLRVGTCVARPAPDELLRCVTLFQQAWPPSQRERGATSIKLLHMTRRRRGLRVLLPSSTSVSSAPGRALVESLAPGVFSSMMQRIRGHALLHAAAERVLQAHALRPSSKHCASADWWPCANSRVRSPAPASLLSVPVQHPRRHRSPRPRPSRVHRG